MKVTLFYISILVYCGAQLTDAQYFSCPPVEEGVAGMCVQTCDSDSECNEGEKCCSNGCGHTCTTPVPIPYVAPLLRCPATDPNMAGTCQQECDSHVNCSSGQLCCSNGCGFTCVAGEQLMSRCDGILEEQRNASLIGAYLPQCEEDGSFSLLQCHASTGYCWCVNGQSGVPISDLVRFEQPSCNCTYDDAVYLIGEAITATGTDCGPCTCTLDGVECPPCEEPIEEQLFYSCPALRADVAGVCVKTCDSDTDCTGFNKCCYNGCGHTCRQPEIIPYLPLPQRCPPELGNEPCSVNGDELTCIDSCGEGGEEEEEDEDSDSSESTSESSHRDLMCCDNMCGGSVCLPPAIDPTPCFTMRGLVDSANATLVGAYRPHCASNGKFLEVQCRSDYCWCVDMLTGRPRSHLVAFHSTDDLHCTRCHYYGSVYEHLDTFPSAQDDCNTCECFHGEVGCTEVGCGVGEGEGEGWQWWSTVLVTCIVVVIVLGVITMAMLLIVVILVRQNSFRHRRLKETDQFEMDSDAVQFRNGHESIELKVPVEDVEEGGDRKSVV